MILLLPHPRWNSGQVLTGKDSVCFGLRKLKNQIVIRNPKNIILNFQIKIVMETLNIPVAVAGEHVKTAMPFTLSFTNAVVAPKTEKSSEEYIALSFAELPRVGDYPATILRTRKQAIADLVPFEDKEVLALFPMRTLADMYILNFRNRKADVSISIYDKGALYEATEDSLVVERGEAEVGETVETSSAGVRCESKVVLFRTIEEIKADIAKTKEAVLKQQEEQANVNI